MGKIAIVKHRLFEIFMGKYFVVRISTKKITCYMVYINIIIVYSTGIIMFECLLTLHSRIILLWSGFDLLSGNK